MRSTPPSTAKRRTDRIGRELAAMAAAFRVGLASAVAAWPVLLGRAIFYAVCMMVLTAFWDKVGAQRLAGTFALRLPPGGLATYVGVTEWITLSVPAIQLKLEDDIRTGALEPHLLRPKAYLAQAIAGQAGGMIARLAILGVAALALLALSGRAWPSPAGIAYAALLGVIGAGIGMMIFAIVGLTAFWLRRVLPVLLIVQKLMFLLGGLFAPISLYPGWLRDAAALSPFGAHLAFAGQAVIGLSADDFWRALTLQAFWLVALTGLAALVWRAGLAKTLRAGV
ncbi:MAG TPA: ABC-2 family transporter protein [Caulobacteraceae bacterium]|nr:ABC-2 family transporter protein [Caulobacteraceae bacterium]